MNIEQIAMVHSKLLSYQKETIPGATGGWSMQW